MWNYILTVANIQTNAAKLRMPNTTLLTGREVQVTYNLNLDAETNAELQKMRGWRRHELSRQPGNNWATISSITTINQYELLSPSA